MSDSGITPDLETLLSGDAFDMGDFYEIKSKVVVGSPVQEIKHTNMPMRANLRQQLQRQQMMNEEKKEETHTAKHHPPQSEVISVPMSAHGSITTEVPPQVLEVKTSLQFPTKYHLQESQKRQVASFLNDSSALTGISSMPVLNTGMAADYLITNSAPDFPSGMGDLNTDFLIENADSLNDTDLSFIEPTLNHLSSTAPQDQPFFFVGNEGGAAAAKTATSAPAAFRKQEPPPVFLTPDHEKQWLKERQKKDNHNLIERKRRFNINDRIKDLGELLPKNIELERQNKGSILKASVSYIQHLQRDQEKKKALEEKNRDLSKMNFQLQLKLRQATAMLKQAGLGDNFTEDQQTRTLLQSDLVESMLPPVTLSSTVDTSDLYCLGGLTTDEAYMDDSSPVTSDPMLTSTPNSPAMDDDNSLFSQN